ncbi:S-layer homology domain-containing protein [Paenibacillus alkalitolerans]|uniref:S-layer homology domain-containing protein n=1 Tax=Paenibacillus alkalitolerans TaxID=2799335 RepID=UPI0018F4ECDA|nr:S-layer homology domain-containing protein [Paenibacillus alkalitolerans]
MFKRWLAVLLTVVVSICTLASGALAFSDLQGVAGKEKIVQLHKEGKINGIGKGLFAPKKMMTIEQSVALIVKGLDLNLNAFRFVKKPEASDYFTHIPNNAWYASAFVAAHLNGVPIDKDVKPGTPVTREQFVKLLMIAVYTKGDYAWVELFVEVKDADKITDGYMETIQRALIAKIAELDKDGNFRPQGMVTRAEAAVMLHHAIRFVKENEEQKQPSPNPDDPASNEQVNVTLETVTGDIQKVTLNWGEKPNPGYGIAIVGIEFPGEEKAVVKYKLRYPEPGRMYAQVITEAKAHVYVGSNIKDVEIQQVN